MVNKADEKRSTRYTRTQVKKNLEEKLGDAVIDYRLDDSEGATSYPIEHPFFRSEETKEALKPLADDDEKGIAKVVIEALNPGGWEKFRAEGGTSGDISALLLQVSLETNEAIASQRPTNR